MTNSVVAKAVPVLRHGAHRIAGGSVLRIEVGWPVIGSPTAANA